MLTFEKILDVFSDYLRQDPMFEVVMTSRGYTLMDWDMMQNDWYRATLADTPKKLLELLLHAYADFLTDQITSSERDLTDEERAHVNTKAAEMRARCGEA